MVSKICRFVVSHQAHCTTARSFHPPTERGLDPCAILRHINPHNLPMQLDGQHVENYEAALPMDGFSVRARAAVELGQQNENAISYLDRKTDLTQKRSPGTAWPRDQAKTGSICQIIVRDTGFNMGSVLWRSVGLLVDGIGAEKGW